MKTQRKVFTTAALGCAIAIFSFNSFAAPTASPATKAKIGEHFRVVPAADGAHEVTLVGNGLNYQDTNGVWIQSIPVVQSFPSGIVCTGASYQVILATNLNSPGSVDLELPADPDTGTRGRMVSHPLGLAFYDPDSGATVLLAALKDCSAQVVSNQVVFADAFVHSNGIQASITYTYGVGHFHQDVTLTTKPAVTPADFHMGPNARLEMLTQFEQSPEPDITENTLNAPVSSASSAVRSTATANAATGTMTAEPDDEPTLTDQTLDYGTMKMGRGRAFATSAPSQMNAMTITKQLVSVQNQNFLTEDVPWNQAAPALQNLPASLDGTNSPQASARSTMPRQQMIAQLSARTSKPIANKAKSFRERLAEAQRSKPLDFASLNSQRLPLSPPAGFVMDYELVQTCGEFDFQGGYTYLISDYVQIDWVTIESGAVIKFAGGDLEPTYSLVCPESDPKAVLTDINDDSVGAAITNSVGHFTGYHASVALNLSGLDGYGAYVEYLDIRFATTGIVGPASNWYFVDNDWFFKCSQGLSDISGLEYLANCDFCEVDTPYPPGISPYVTYCSSSIDRNGNGLPDDWEFQYLDTLTHSGSDLDSNGNTLLYDYENNIDPNIINFSLRLGNQHFQATNSTGSFVILAGTPACEAVLVNSTNFSGATWNAYDGIAHLNLGLTDGAYQVWFGLKGFATNATVTWIGTTVYLDRAAPALVITSPTTNSTVTSPWLQLKGYCLEELSSVTYDLSNALAVVTNQAGYPTTSYLDTNTLTYTTNWFQCFDIPLTNGVNTITVHGTDVAGNMATTNISVTLDYASATNPVIQLTWPQNGMQLCQSNFDLRGWTEDAAATVMASITDTNGNTNTIYGMVERTGVLWVQGLPLAEGTNWVTLAVTNAAGLGSVTNFTLSKSSLTLALTGISGSLWNPVVDVSGVVSDTTAAIYVNGVQGTNNGDGTWNVARVPVSPSGVASFDLKAIPVGEDDPDASTNVEKAAEITMDGMTWSSDNFTHYYTDPDPYAYLQEDHETWDWVGATKSGLLREVWDSNHNDPGDGTAVFPIDMSGVLTGAHYEVQSGSSTTTFDVAEDDVVDWIDPMTGYISTYGAGGEGAWNNGGDYGTWAGIEQEQGSLMAKASDFYKEWSQERKAEPRWVLHTGGWSLAGGESIFALSATAIEERPSKGEYVHDVWVSPGYIVEGAAVPVQQIAINGTQQGTDGVTYAKPPDGADVKLEIKTGVALGRVNIGQQKYRLFVQAGAGSTNLLQPNRVVRNGNFIVGQIINFAPVWNPSLPDGAIESSFLWHADGNVLNSQTNIVPGGSFPNSSDVYFLNSASLNEKGLTNCWWVSGGLPKQYNVVFGEGLTFANGQNFSVVARGLLNMFRPQANFSPVETSVHIINGDLVYQAPNGTDGITFFYFESIPSGFTGTNCFIQTGTMVRTFVDSSSVSHTDVNNGPGPWGDTPIPYSAFRASAPICPVDSPKFGLDSTWTQASAGNNFQMWMLFVPTGGKPVPLRLATWNWSGTAVNNGISWHLSSSSHTSSESDTESYPQWKSDLKSYHPEPP